MRKFIIWSIIFTLSFAGVSFAQNSNYLRNLQSGWTLYGKTKSVAPSEFPTLLNKKIDSYLQSQLETKAYGNNKIMILAQRGTIIAEQFNVSKEILPGGNSMSKSVISLLVGKALCSGDISQLSDTASQYVSELEGTSWGNASIENLLTMSSGAYYAPTFLSGHRNKEMQKEFAGAIGGKTTASILEILLKNDDKKFSGGDKFIYSNADTSALGLVLEHATGQPIYSLTSEIWNEMGANHKATWLVNSSGETLSYFGFAANAVDWVLLGQYVINSLKRNDCFADYLKAATATQIDYLAFADNRDYGYQIWTKCGLGTDAFCFVGAFGQMLMIEPEKEFVLYIHSTGTKWGGPYHWGSLIWEAYKADVQ